MGRGTGELEAGISPDDRVRAVGAGRRSVEAADPGLVAAVEALVAPESRGDPQSPLRWTTKSTARLAEELTTRGHPVAARTVARLLTQAGYSLQGNAKTIEGKQHPDRDAQFRYITAQVVAAQAQAAGDPVISVDIKKKLLVGNYANGGAEWEPTGAPRRTNVHDFADPELGKAVPYGVYDVTANTGWVNLGTDADTGQFAVESIRRWWHAVGQNNYPAARRVLITADSGGSNGSRLRLWKTELASFAAETDLEITVLHLPPGTSKWNRVEHRRFSAITMTWRAGRWSPRRGRHRNDQRRHHQDRAEGPGHARHQHLHPGPSSFPTGTWRSSRPATWPDTTFTGTGTTRSRPRTTQT